MQYDYTTARNYNVQRTGTLDSTHEKAKFLKDIIESGLAEPPYLEIGCGPGVNGTLIGKAKAFHGPIVLLDRHLPMLEIAKKNALGAENIFFLNADACGIPCRSDTIRSCIAANVIHQIHDQEAAMREVSRILKYQGKLIIITPSPSKLRLFPLFAANHDFAEKQARLLPGFSQIKQLASLTGFQVIKSKGLRGSSQITTSTLATLIGNRFLSILAGFSGDELRFLSDNTMKYLESKKESKVFPYWSDIYILEKEIAS